jgi:hypothetical protein
MPQVGGDLGPAQSRSREEEALISVNERDAEGGVEEASDERAEDQVSNDPSEKGEPEQRPELEEDMQVDLEEQGQTLAQCVDEEAVRKEH